MWSEQAVTLFRGYMGTGLVVIWFLAALLYLFLKEERKHIRILFIYVPIILLLLFFNPIFYYVVFQKVGSEIYYRILWLLPMTVVIAYTCATICAGLEGRKKTLFGGAAALVLAVSGSCIYGNPFFSVAENRYHVPDSVVHICDAIEIEGREVTAAFPLEMLQYVRQYSPVICMPYGREILIENNNTWAVQNELCDEIESREPDAERLGSLARQQRCVYIVVSAGKNTRGSLEEQGYALFDSIDGYNIYKDMYFDPGF